MSKPGTRRFIGPLTTKQQQRRQKARRTFHEVGIIADARNLSIGEAFKIYRERAGEGGK